MRPVRAGRSEPPRLPAGPPGRPGPSRSPSPRRASIPRPDGPGSGEDGGEVEGVGARRVLVMKGSKDTAKSWISGKWEADKEGGEVHR